MKNHFRTLLFLVIIVGLFFSAIGATVSYFSDSELSLQNKFSVGTLDINLGNDSNGSSTLPLMVENMQPYEKCVRIFEVRNSGSLPFSWTLSFDKSSERKGIGGGEISNLLQGEILEAQNEPLILWLDKAKNASNDEERQEDLDYFIDEVNNLKAKGLIANDVANDLIIKAKMLQ